MIIVNKDITCGPEVIQYSPPGIQTNKTLIDLKMPGIWKLDPNHFINLFFVVVSLCGIKTMYPPNLKCNISECLV